MKKIFGCLVISVAVMFAVVLCDERANLMENSNPPFPRIANCYGAWLVPESFDKDIDEIGRIDLLIGGVWCDWNNAEQLKKLNERIGKIRGKNPDIIILDFSASAPYADTNDSTFPESGWLKQPDGRYIDGWPGTRMINLLKAETINWIVGRCVRSVKERGFDGVFIDSMAGTFDWWACNIASQNPYEVDANEDGQPDDRNWLNKKWVEAKTDIVRLVREAIGPDVPFMTNQGGEWSFSNTNGVLFEDNLDYVLTGNLDWDDVLESYLHWTETPHRPNVTTIVSSSGIEPPFNPWGTMTPGEREKMLETGRNFLERMRFGLTTTLMGDGYFAYDLHTRWRGQRWWYQEYDTPLGYPMGKAQKQSDGTWRREFDNGTVIVNPTVLDARVQFGERRLDISSGKVDTEFIVPSYDGRLLIRTEEKLKPGTISEPNPLFTQAFTKIEERIVQRNDKMLCRLGNSAALFDVQGRLIRLTDGRNTFATNVKAVLVSDESWIDFDYEDSVSRVLSESKLQFSGKRVKGDVTLAYEQTVDIRKNSLSISYKWKALTNGGLYAWRQQVDFPVRQYAGGQFSVDNTTFQLPIRPESGSISHRGVREIMMIHPVGARVIIRTSLDAFLQDERVYNGKEYRVFFSPTGYEPSFLKAGDSWEYIMSLEVNSLSDM